VRGFNYFQRVETEEAFDAMLRAEYDASVHYMKDVGSLEEE
jgi:hypothetical protein